MSRCDEFDAALVSPKTGMTPRLVLLLDGLSVNEPDLHARVVVALHDTSMSAAVVAAAITQITGGDISGPLVQRWRHDNTT